MGKKNLFLILLSLLVSMLSGACIQNQSGTVQMQAPVAEAPRSAAYYYLESRFHIKDQDYAAAIQSLQDAIAMDPESFILNRDLISLYLQQEDRESAEALAERFVETSPYNINALLLFVQLKEKDIEQEQMLEILNRILALDPDNKDIFLRLGRIYLENDDNEKALELFTDMVAQFPDYYVAHYYLGQIQLNLKKWAPAEAHFKKALELEPELLESWFALISVYSGRKQAGYQKRITDAYRKILKAEPDNYRARFGLALHQYKNKKKKAAQKRFAELAKLVDKDTKVIMAAFDEYIAGKRYDDALIIFSQMLKTEPENSTLNFFTGMVYEARENFQEAISHYKKIKPGHEQYKKSILSIAYLYRELEKNETSIAVLKQGLEQYPGDTDIVSYLASFYEADGQADAAIQVLEETLADRPRDTVLLFKLGALLDKTGNRQESLEIMKQIIGLDPKDASALNYLGYSYADMDIHLEEALDLITKAYELRPNDGYITDSLGWVHYKLGNLAEAAGYLETAVSLTDYETVVADHLGDVYLEQNRLEEALEVFQKALENRTEETDPAMLETIRAKIAEIEKQIQ